MAPRRKGRIFAALLVPLLAAGCSVGPNFVPPDPQLPETSFTGDRGAVADARLPPPTDPEWWGVFRDPILTDLERRVAAANLDVRTATIRLAESRFQRGVTAAAQLPSLNGDAKYTRELYSQNGIVSLLGALTPDSAAVRSFCAASRPSFAPACVRSSSIIFGFASANVSVCASVDASTFTT